MDMDEREIHDDQEQEEEDWEEEEEEEEDWDEDNSSVASSDDGDDDQSADARQRAWIGDDLLRFCWVLDLPAQRQRSDPANESYSSSSTRELSSSIYFNSGSIEDAESALRTTSVIDIRELTVSMNVPRREWSELDVNSYPRQFRRFVDLLAGPTRVVRSVTLDGIGLHTDDGIRADDLEMLFGTTLPSHPSLERIHVRGGAISDEYVALFASSMNSKHETPLVELAFDCNFGDHVRAQIFADLVSRNSQLRALSLSALAPYAGLGPDDFRLICTGLSSNTNLQSLSVVLSEVPPDTLDFAVSSTSPLRALHVTGYLSRKAVHSLAMQLRTNVTLLELTISQRYPQSHCQAPHFDPIADSLETYNHTVLRFDHNGYSLTSPVRTVPGGDEGRIGKCLRRNQRIRLALHQLSDYHVPETGLWPPVFGMVSALPTLLYRFLRKGNVQALCGGDGAVDQQRK